MAKKTISKEQLNKVDGGYINNPPIDCVRKITDIVGEVNEPKRAVVGRDQSSDPVEAGFLDKRSAPAFLTVWSRMISKLFARKR